MAASRCISIIARLLVFILTITFTAAAARAQKSGGRIQPMCQAGCLGTFGVDVSPDGSVAVQIANAGAGQIAVFAVHNTSSQQTLTLNLSCAATGGVTCTGISPSSLTLAAGNDDIISVSYSMGASPGTISLTASSDVYAATDVGSYQLAFGGKAAAALLNYNPDNQDRSLCLTSGAGHSAALQCGDLMLAHAMPGYATLGRERAPTLIYNSAQGFPTLLVHTAVTLGGETAPPTSVYAELKVCAEDGVTCTTRRTGTWTGWGELGAAQTRDIGLGYVATEATGAYNFQLLIRTNFTAVSHGTTVAVAYDSLLTGKLLINNQIASPFGEGWTLAGVERIRTQRDTSMVWVGGDGSIKLYERLHDTVWRAPAGGYRDTLIYYPSDMTYRRTLRHGVVVSYDVAGRQQTTTNRAGQVTRFWWTASPERLDSISVPPGGAGTVYRFTYDGNGHLQRITDPAGRFLGASVTAAGLLASLTDPDGYSTWFDYRTTGQMAGQLPRRLTWSGAGWTTYVYALGVHVTQVNISLDSAGTSLATTNFEPWDEKDLVANASTGNVAPMPEVMYTKILGPRIGVADDATFWIDRWGAPTKAVGAIHDTTLILRDSASVTPALITRIISPDHSVHLLSWNSRGNLIETRDSTLGLANSVPTIVQRWTYAAGFDGPDSVIDAAHKATVFSFTGPGLLHTVTTPNGHVTRFSYSAASGMSGVLSAVTEENVSVWDSASSSVQSDSLHTGFALNALGNAVADTSPGRHVHRYDRDAYQRVVDSHDAAGHRSELVYDALNRVLQSKQHIEGDTVLVTQQTYLGDVLRTVSDPRGVTRTFDYDNAGRQVREYNDYGVAETRQFDAGGLVVSRTRRTGQIVTYRYDAAGRLQATKWPASLSPITGATVTPADSSVMVYGVMGRVDTARTAARTVARTYYANGAVKTELQTGTGVATTHLTVGLDSAGRRSWLIVGPQGNLTYSDSIWYHFGADGDPSEIGTRWRNGGGLDSVSYAWDALGRRRQMVFQSVPRPATVTYAYDRDGILRLVCGVHQTDPGISMDKFDIVVHHKWVDADGFVRSTADAPPNLTCEGSSTDLSQDNSYDARHQLISTTAGGSHTFTYDWSGNRIAWTQGSQSFYESVSAGHNRLQEYSYHNGGGPIEWHDYSYDADGSRFSDTLAAFSPVHGGALTESLRRLYWYDGLGRAASVSEYGCTEWSSTTCLYFGSVSNQYDCGYDALGRTTSICGSSAPALGYDGPNIVRAGNDQGTTGWTFVHGPGTDEPVMGFNVDHSIHAFYITDGQGRLLAVSGPTGGDLANDPDYQNVHGEVAGGAGSGFSFEASRTPSAGVGGIGFFRNRWYDQQTGRWTQEDPMGLAGGINLYQFNGNNPVTLTDPFGLCPDDNDPWCVLAKGVASRTAPAVNIINRVGELTGVNDLGRAGDALGHGNLGSGAKSLAMAGLVVLPGGEEAVMGTKAVVRAELGGMKLAEGVAKGVRDLLGSGKGEQWAVQTMEGGGAMVSRWVKGGDGASSAMYTWLLNAKGKVFSGLQRAWDAAGTLTHFDPK